MNDRERASRLELLEVRADLALSGHMLGGPAAIKNALVDFLKSDAVMTIRIREMLCDAIEHGGTRVDFKNDDGYSKPKLAVEGLGEDGRFGATVLTLRKEFDLGEAIHIELGGKPPTNGNVDAAIDRVKMKKGNAAGTEKLKKARAMHERFISIKDSEQMDAALRKTFGPNIFDQCSEIDCLEIDDYKRTIFIEDLAHDKKAWPKV